MNFFKPIFIATFLLATAAQADVIEVRMLNRSSAGTMVFEPDFVALKPGDRVKFIATNQSHNAASIDGMVPQRYAGFKGQINEEIEVGFDQPGFYAVKCSPHFAMGMVMVVKVGEAELPADFRAFKVPGRASDRFDDIFRRNGL